MGERLLGYTVDGRLCRGRLVLALTAGDGKEAGSWREGWETCLFLPGLPILRACPCPYSDSRCVASYGWDCWGSCAVRSKQLARCHPSLSLEVNRRTRVDENNIRRGTVRFRRRKATCKLVDKNDDIAWGCGGMFESCQHTLLLQKTTGLRPSIYNSTPPLGYSAHRPHTPLPRKEAVAVVARLLLWFLDWWEVNRIERTDGNHEGEKERVGGGGGGAHGGEAKGPRHERGIKPPPKYRFFCGRKTSPKKRARSVRDDIRWPPYFHKFPQYGHENCVRDRITSFD